MDSKTLEEKIIYHKNLYYKGIPEISDEEYDLLEEQLRKIDPNSFALQLVGSNVFSGEKIKHDRKMLSLGKTYKKEDLLKWKKEHDLVATFKIDGSSCSLIYKNGKLQIGKTRGNGSFGENITDKALFIPSIPKIVKAQESFEVRGEIFCRKDAFENLKKEMEGRGLNIPTSQRNIVAGLLGRKENIDLAKELEFNAFELYADETDLSSEVQKFEFLQEQGFKTPSYKLISDDEGADDIIKDAENFMVDGDYLIDGLVFSYNSLELHRTLGETAHHPRYKMAYKFAGDIAMSIIKNISWQVSRNGVLTPVANIETVELSGANVSRVTLHNWGNVKENKLKKGDLIKITRSGEVIPKFLEVVESSQEDFKAPEKCPSCEQSIFEEDIRLYCHNDYCPEKKLDELENFVKKIGIDDLSKKRLASFIEAKIIKDIVSLYELTEEKLLSVDKVKEKLANKLLSSIEDSKQTSLSVFMSALGLSGGALNTCEKIVSAGFNSINKIKTLTVEELIKIDGFAQKSSEDIVNSIQEKKELIDSLVAKGFVFEKNETKQGEVLKNKKFCITGTLSMKRSDLEKLIKANGGSTQSSVSKATDYLVTNDTSSSSSKFKKAQELSIPIISEVKLQELIDGEIKI